MTGSFMTGQDRFLAADQNQKTGGNRSWSVRLRLRRMLETWQPVTVMVFPNMGRKPDRTGSIGTTHYQP
jgi:hypothetical protein